MFFFIIGNFFSKKNDLSKKMNFVDISADEKFDRTMKVNAVVQHTGDVLYVPPGIFKSICSFDIAAFPFVSFAKYFYPILYFYNEYFYFFLDTQNCTLKFGSWTFDDGGM